MSHITRILAGAMSGTSADGVDVALVRIDGRGLEMRAQCLHHHARRYPRELSRRIHQMRDEGHCRLDELAMLGREISIEYAEAVNAALAGANLKPTDIAAIAAHGQTLFHSPPNTIQWFDPSLVASRTGCAVISDFRRADLAAGGQGAPLVPFADYILFHHPEKSRAVVNIGGIANLTYLPARCGINDISAFDSGPGNCISDHLMRKHFPNGPSIDVDGQLALKGGSIFEASLRFEHHRYFSQPGPKSTDGPTMIRIFEDAVKATNDAKSLLVENQLATACAVAASTIIRSIIKLNDRGPNEVIVSGGGIRNKAIMHWLRLEFGERLLTTDQLNFVSEAKEAIAFALLGAATLDGYPSNVPAATGAQRNMILGSVTPKPL